MDTHERARLLKELSSAEAHVALGNRHIAEQRARVAELESKGDVATVSRALLNTFLETQRLHEKGLERIRRELELAQLPPPSDSTRAQANENTPAGVLDGALRRVSACL
jgi:hypothetical protein